MITVLGATALGRGIAYLGRVKTIPARKERLLANVSASRGAITVARWWDTQTSSREMGIRYF